MPTSPMQRVLDRSKKLDAEKMPWLFMYELVSEFVMMRKVSFVTEQTFTTQEFVPDRVFDSTASSANFQMSSSLIGALWPSGEKAFRYVPSATMDREAATGKEVKEWFEFITTVAREHIGNPKSGFQSSLEEYMHDQGSFGTSGIGVFDEYDRDPGIPLRFKPIDVKRASIAEGVDGFVDTVYLKSQFTIRQLVEEYGIDNVSSQSRKMFHDGQLDAHVKVLHAIEPRSDNVMGVNNQHYPVASMHIEVEANHKIIESGFTEMPVFVTRFWKVMNEPYGRSPAISAMPDILELNNRREGSIIAVEKFLDPPLLTDPDQLLNNGVVDTSAGALNAKKNTGRAENHNKAVEPMILTGELTSTDKRIVELQTVVEDYFFNDDMRDLNNETRMTLGEANIRNQLRGQALITIYRRQFNELFMRILERVFNILLLHGLFGFIEGSQEYNDYMNRTGQEPPHVIPNVIADLLINGGDAYRTDFISPAARIMRTDELSGIQQTVSGMVQIAPVQPSVMDCINWDVVVALTQELTGAPSQILLASDEIAAVRKAKADQMQQQAQMEAQSVAAHTAKAGAQAAKAAAEAGINPLQVLQGGQQ